MAAWVTDSPNTQLGAVRYMLGDETVVLAWLLDSSVTYECPETGEVHRGAVLLRHGLRVGLKGDLDAAVLRLRRI